MPTATMRAIVQDAYGGTETLRLAGIERPLQKADQVLIRVRAAGVDPGVWHLMTGLPYVVRPAVGLRTPRRRVRGLDVAGVVEAVGSGASGLSPGDAVFGTCDGSFAEFATSTPGRLARMPRNLTFEQAAAVPVSGCAALHALRDQGLLRPDQRVLIIGAGGGVGTYAVQLARVIGAHVTAVCSTGKVALVRSLGAGEVIDYTREELTGSYDLIIDTGGNRPLSHLQPLLTATGRLVIVGGEGGGRWLGGMERQLQAAIASPFARQHMGTFLSRESAADLDVLRIFIESGDVAPVVDRTFPLAAAAEAIDYLATGQACGKVVLSV